MTASLLGFSGVNFGVVGISAAWDRIIATLGEPQVIIDQIVAQWDIIWKTLLAETLLFIPLLYVLYRRALPGENEGRLRLGFTRGFDYENVSSRATGFIEKVKERFQGRLKQMIGVVVGIGSVGAVGYMGYEAFNVLTQENYQFQNPLAILGIASGLLGVWVFGIRGGDLLQALGIGELAPWEYSNDNFITEFRPLSQLQVNTPTEVLVTAHNITDKPGIRIAFQGFDSISPQVVELHLDPGESTQFKIAITPVKKEVQDVLAIIYPLFDSDKNYIDEKVAEPIVEQEIQYEVHGQTTMGLTKSQQSTLKKGAGAGGLLLLAYGFIGQFVDLPDVEAFLRENGVLFSALQAPFMYAYFYAQNKFKSSNLT